MVSSGNGEIGAAKLTGEILSIVGRIPELVKQMTNIDISRVNQNHKYIWAHSNYHDHNDYF